MSDAITDGYRMGESAQYQWANEGGIHGMARISELEAQGWVKVCEHWEYKGSWLMRKD